MDLLSCNIEKSIAPYIVPEDEEDCLWNDIITFLDRNKIKYYTGHIFVHSAGIKIYKFEINAIPAQEYILEKLDDFLLSHELVKTKSLTGARIGINDDGIIVMSVAIDPDNDNTWDQNYKLTHEYTTYNK